MRWFLVAAQSRRLRTLRSSASASRLVAQLSRRHSFRPPVAVGTYTSKNHHPCFAFAANVGQRPPTALSWIEESRRTWSDRMDRLETHLARLQESDNQ